MPKIELKYFPIHGFRGLLARLVLHLGEIDYTEKIIAFEDWEKIQQSKYIDLKRPPFKHLRKYFISNNSWIFT